MKVGFPVTYCRRDDWYMVRLGQGNEEERLGTLLHSKLVILGRKCGTRVNARRVCECYIASYHVLIPRHV